MIRPSAASHRLGGSATGWKSGVDDPVVVARNAPLAQSPVPQKASNPAESEAAIVGLRPASVISRL